MQTFDQSIFGLFQSGLVSYEEALRWASNVDEFKLKVQGISTTSEVSRDEMAKGVSARRAGNYEVWQPNAMGIGRRRRCGGWR